MFILDYLCIKFDQKNLGRHVKQQKFPIKLPNKSLAGYSAAAVVVVVYLLPIILFWTFEVDI